MAALAIGALASTATAAESDPPKEQSKPGASFQAGKAPDMIPRETALSLIREYASAYGSHDIERLARAWRMNPLDRTAVNHMFREYRDLSISVDPGQLGLAAGQPALDFEQQISRARMRTGATPLRAHMNQRDDGNWYISRLEVRRTPSIGVPSLAAQSRGPDTRRRFPSGILQEYQEALESRDIERVGQVWAMEPSERTALGSLLQRSTDATSRVVVRGLVVGNRQAMLDFDQQFLGGSTFPIERTLANSQLRAYFAQNERGEWYISRVVPRA